MQDFLDVLLNKSIKDPGFYVSRNSLPTSKLRISLLGQRDPVFYDYYDPLQDDDEDELKDSGYFKTFYSSLSSLERVRFTLAKSKSTGYWESREDPAGQGTNIGGSKNFRFEGRALDLRDLYISTTYPPFYENHLLITSKDQIPTYALYYDPSLFFAVADALIKLVALPNYKNYYFLHNGNAGSEKFHFHVHVTNQPSPYRDLIHAHKGSPPFTTKYGIFQVYSMHDYDIGKVFKTVNSFYRTVNSIFNPAIDNTYQMISTFHYLPEYNQHYFIVAFVDPSKRETSDHKYSLFAPAGTTSIPSDLYQDNKLNPEIYQQLDIFLSKSFDKTFVFLDLQNMVEDPFDSYLHALDLIYNRDQGNLETMVRKAIERNDSSLLNMILLAVFDIYKQNTYRALSDKFLIRAVNATLEKVMAINPRQLILFRATIEIFNINRMLLSILLIMYPAVGYKEINMKMYAQLNELFVNENTNYSFLKGVEFSNRVDRVFADHIRSTTIDHHKTINISNLEVNSWLDYKYKQIGEKSAYGTLTLAKTRPTHLDFLLKITTKKGEVEKEASNGEIINHLRTIVPNFMLVYGAFQCQVSNNFATLCQELGPKGKIAGYLMVENVSDGQTFQRLLQQGALSSDDTFFLIYQIVASLTIAQNNIGFVHNDLHLNNILLYDFIEKENTALDGLNYNKKYTIKNLKKLVYFKYRISIDETETDFDIPTRLLAVIIDYGRCFVSDNPFVADQNANPFQDIHLLFTSLLYLLLIYQPSWLTTNSRLTVLLRDFFKYNQTFYNIRSDFYSQIQRIAQDSNIQRREQAIKQKLDLLFNIPASSIPTNGPFTSTLNTLKYIQLLSKDITYNPMQIILYQWGNIDNPGRTLPCEQERDLEEKSLISKYETEYLRMVDGFMGGQGCFGDRRVDFEECGGRLNQWKDRKKREIKRFKC